MMFGGAIYLHDISSKRFSGTAKRNLDIFSHLCGEAAVDTVVLVTDALGSAGDTRLWEKGERTAGCALESDASS